LTAAPWWKLEKTTAVKEMKEDKEKENKVLIDVHSYSLVPPMVSPPLHSLPTFALLPSSILLALQVLTALRIRPRSMSKFGIFTTKMSYTDATRCFCSAGPSSSSPWMSAILRMRLLLC
jgi:hypothetical protein